MSFYNGKVGRPSKLTPEMIEHVIKFVRPSYGIPFQVARVSGVLRTTLEHWLAKGEEDSEMGKDSTYAQFLALYEKEKGTLANEIMSDIRKKDSYEANFRLLDLLDCKTFGQYRNEMSELINNVNLLNKTQTKGVFGNEKKGRKEEE